MQPKRNMAKRVRDVFALDDEAAEGDLRCSSCSTKAGKVIKLGHGSAGCNSCRQFYERPPILPAGRRLKVCPKPDGMPPPTAAEPTEAKKMTNGQYGSLMVWLARDDMRNIVSGASGSVSSGGHKFTGSRKVVPKKQGYAMLAAHMNSQHPGSAWTADIAGKKYQYRAGLYATAKQAQGKSNWGLSQDELSKGVTLASKLESLCKDFAIWDAWFGKNQKYSPANVQDSSFQGVHDNSSDVAAAMQVSQPSPEDSMSDHVNEGSDCDGDDVADPTDDLDFALGILDQSILSEASGERAANFTDRTADPAILPAAIAAAAVAPVVRVGVTVALKAPKPPTQAQIRKDKAEEKAQEMASIKGKIAEAVASNSASVGNSPKSDFNSTYGDTTRQRIAGNVTVEKMRGENGILVEQMRGVNAKEINADTLALGSLRLQFEIASAAEEIEARISIQTEINVTALMQTDGTGESAIRMMSIMDARRAASASAQILKNNVLLSQVQHISNSRADGGGRGRGGGSGGGGEGGVGAAAVIGGGTITIDDTPSPASRDS